MEITALQFEEMIDRLEKGSGQQVFVTLHGGKRRFACYLHKHISVFAFHRKNKQTESVFSLYWTKILILALWFILFNDCWVSIVLWSFHCTDLVHLCCLCSSSVFRRPNCCWKRMMNWSRRCLTIGAAREKPARVAPSSPSSSRRRGTAPAQVTPMWPSADGRRRCRPER